MKSNSIFRLHKHLLELIHHLIASDRTFSNLFLHLIRFFSLCRMIFWWKSVKTSKAMILRSSFADQSQSDGSTVEWNCMKSTRSIRRHKSLSHEFRNEWMSERANERAQRRARAKRAVRSKRTSERCERTSKRTNEWPSTYICVLFYFRPLWTMIKIH